MSKRRFNQDADSLVLPAMDESGGGQSDKRLRPTGSVLGAGTTPLWHPSQLSQEESAMRSTLFDMRPTLLPSPNHITSMPALPQPPLSPATPRTYNNRSSDAMAIDNLINPSSFSIDTSINPLAHDNGFTPINGYKISSPRKPPLDSVTYQLQTGTWMQGVRIDMNQVDSYETFENGQNVLHVDDSLTVDKEDGRMWHLNNDPNTSFSGSFIYDDPHKLEPAAEEFLKRIKEEREGPGRMALTVLLLDDVRRLVREGCVLSVERTSFVEDGEPIICERPGCLQEAALPADAYYVAVGYEKTFCLICFERLWAGKYTEGMTASDPSRRDSGVAFPMASFDGPADYREPPRRSERLRRNSKVVQNSSAAPEAPPPVLNEMLMSRWSVPEDQAQYALPAVTPTKNTQHNPPAGNDAGMEEPLEESPNSTFSEDGNWRYQPTEIQQIAHLMQPGVTLSMKDKAAFILWQATSKSQIRWNRHLWKVRATRAYYAGDTQQDEGLLAEKLDLGEFIEPEQLNDVQKKTGMRMKDCNGRDLSWVLKQAAQGDV